MRYLIIGAGPAGVTAAETLRREDPEGEIVLIGAEPEPPYSRMALPYLLIGKIGEEGTRLRREPDWYERQRIRHVRQPVTGVDCAGRAVRLADGSTLAYDRLLIATGATPVKPPVEGMDLPQVTHCWTLEDARRIMAVAPEGAEVVLMGAGFIGSIVLEALALRGVRLTVVEAGDRMVPRMMNDKAGNLLKDWCISKGVRVLTSARVDAIRAAGDGRAGVHLASGETLPADLVIAATGVRANIDFLKDSGIRTEQGIVVNDRLQTSDPHVWAAGDCAQGRDFSTGEYHVQAIQPTSVEHGRIAGRNMAGAEVHHRGSINMNVLDTLGLISASFGLWMGVEGGDSVERCWPQAWRYISLQFEEDRLVGASCVGMSEHLGVLRGLIQSRTRLGRWKERLSQDPTRVMEAWLATGAAVTMAGPRR